MRRPSKRPAVVGLVVAAALVLVGTGIAAAQTVTTTTPTTAPPATTVPSTTPPSTAGTVTTTAGATTQTTTAPAPTTEQNESDDSGDDIPWVPIAAAVAGVAILVLLIALIARASRRRGAAHQQSADWRHSAADATAEAGATARLLSQGTPPSGQIAQQLLTSLRSFEDLAQTAPDETDAATADRARRALQTLGLAIDSDYRVRRAGDADPQQLARSSEAVQNAATETDRTLRGVYRSFTSSD